MRGQKAKDPPKRVLVGLSRVSLGMFLKCQMRDFKMFQEVKAQTDGHDSKPCTHQNRSYLSGLKEM